MKLVFDIEADGLLDKQRGMKQATRVHCICLKEVGGGEVQTFTSYNDGHPSIEEGLSVMFGADMLVGHNIIRYDLPMLLKFYGWEPYEETVIRDTLVMSQMGYTALSDKDKRVAWKDSSFPRAFTGKHSLRAWGYRIGSHKGTVNDTEDYSVCDAAMLDYCARDVVVNDKVYLVFDRWASEIPDAVQIEHEFYVALEMMMASGWYIDVEHTRELVIKLQREADKIKDELLDLFPPREVPASNDEVMEENRWWNPKQLKTKAKTIPFNPRSTAQVIWNFASKYGWAPKKFTKKGNPQLSDDIIQSLPFPEAKEIARYSMVTKRLSSLVGASGYLTLLGDDGRLHGQIRHCGAITHRCTHSKPNKANATGNGAEYGYEIRQCFSVHEGRLLVGADASALELCMLANRMAPFDGGEYCKTVVDGDPHTRNWMAANLQDWVEQMPEEDEESYHRRIRNKYSKRMIYALMYGAGLKKLGSIVVPDGETWTDKKMTAVGKEIKAALFAGLPALEQLIDSLQEGFRPGQEITGLDGRVAENRSFHQALNTQLQMDGAIVMKWATVLLFRACKARGWEYGYDKDWCLVGHIHDEIQADVREGIADEFGNMATNAITEAGRLLSVECRLDGDYSVGASWADTH